MLEPELSSNLCCCIVFNRGGKRVGNHVFVWKRCDWVLIRSRKQEILQNGQNGLVYVDNLTCFQIPQGIFNPEVILLLSRDHIISHERTKHGSCQRTGHCGEKLKEWHPVCCVCEHGKQAYKQHGESFQTEPVLASHLCFLVQKAFEKRNASECRPHPQTDVEVES